MGLNKKGEVKHRKDLGKIRKEDAMAG